MNRIINLPVNLMARPLPPWGRLLLVGLVVSVVLHGMVLDFWRGMARQEGALGMGSRQTALQARLQSASTDRLPEDPSGASLDAMVSEKSIARPALPASIAQQPLQSPSARMPEAQSSVAVAPVIETGLRRLSRAEGLVAYRLALLAAFGAQPAKLVAPMQMSLVAASGGTHIELSESSGDAAQDQIWLDAIRHAVLRAEIPEVLAGQAFVLELELLP